MGIIQLLRIKLISDHGCLFLSYLAAVYRLVYCSQAMETKVVKLDADRPDVAEIRMASKQIEAGKLVAFPTETVYGIACRVRADTLSRLDAIKGRSPDKYYTLHLGQKEDVKQYVPTIGLKAGKLIRNAWPGPVTIVFQLSSRDIEEQRDNLEGEVFENLYRDSSIGIRCPDSRIASLLLRETHIPVVAPSANVTGLAPAVNAEQMLGPFADSIDLLLDGGPCKYKKSSTVAKVDGGQLQVLRQGVYSETELRDMSEVKFLFVCTGNTCRSPMAEGIFRKYLALKLNCRVANLEEIGYKTYSAGTASAPGLPASREAVVACLSVGVDIAGHSSRLLSAELVRDCDFIFAAGRRHCEQIAGIDRSAAGKCVMLDKDIDIPDPIGLEYGVYSDCAQLIENAVRKIVRELEL